MGGPEFDAVIAGAGLSGMSLAAHLATRGWRDRRVLVIDDTGAAPAAVCWGFCSAGAGLLDAAVSHTYRQVRVHAAGTSRVVPLGRYRYQVVRRPDLYRVVLGLLDGCPASPSGPGGWSGCSMAPRRPRSSSTGNRSVPPGCSTASAPDRVPPPGRVGPPDGTPGVHRMRGPLRASGLRSRDARAVRLPYAASGREPVRVRPARRRASRPGGVDGVRTAPGRTVHTGHPCCRARGVPARRAAQR